MFPEFFTTLLAYSLLGAFLFMITAGMLFWPIVALRAARLGLRRLSVLTRHRQNDQLPRSIEPEDMPGFSNAQRLPA